MKNGLIDIRLAKFQQTEIEGSHSVIYLEGCPLGFPLASSVPSTIEVMLPTDLRTLVSVLHTVAKYDASQRCTTRNPGRIGSMNDDTSSQNAEWLWPKAYEAIVIR